MSARELRERCRRGEFDGPTAGCALGFVQANLVVIPRDLAFEFLLFCQRNPKPCPLLAVTDAGNPEPADLAPGADLRTDLPRYRVYQDGILTEEVSDIRGLWRANFVSFLLGCSFTFEAVLLRAGLSVRHLEERTRDGRTKNVPMYRTNIACRPAAAFHGPLVVSMRPFRPADAIRAVELTGRMPQVHGAPIHFGDPQAIGITDLNRPDWGDPVTIRSDEIPVFWACGVTPQAVAIASNTPLVITHSPGHMFVTDLREEALLEGTTAVGRHHG
jgi:uncharacterized protein YcsI (UPF0317 family)